MVAAAAALLAFGFVLACGDAEDEVADQPAGSPTQPVPGQFETPSATRATPAPPSTDDLIPTVYDQPTPLAEPKRRQESVTVNGITIDLPPSARVGEGIAEVFTEDPGARTYNVFYIVQVGDSSVTFAAEGWLIASNVRPEDEEALAPLLDALNP
jgi:hypothetical protein